MASLDRNLRRDLENAVKKARRAAEAGARQAVEQLAVGHHEPWAALSPDQRKLRNRLRAHGRQLGDKLDEKKGTQSIDRLAGECAYEHWHRLLFARFLAENDLLVEPESGMALSLDECRELAREQSKDWLELASDFAQRMLPRIFRAGDPVLEVALPPEKRQELEAVLEGMPREVFIADDSLGWVYQFWQADQKDAVNALGKKIGADELPAVTQLFTEDYMVLFLLHNTLGAWWAGKVLAAKHDLARSAESEDQLRAECLVQGVEWTYLRFVREGGVWRPAAGTFPGWPAATKDLTLLDPCMGSGHFLAFALPMLVALRREEEKISIDEAVDAVLRDNLFGLELDPRCAQIAAFNLSLSAWRLTGSRELPPLKLACSGLAAGGRESDWLALVGDDSRLRLGMQQLYALFHQAPILGSLINPRLLGGSLLEAGFDQLAPILDAALHKPDGDDVARELAAAASGMSRAANLLQKSYTLVATNVPYLGRGKQDEQLKKYCELRHPRGKADLATCFIERCAAFCQPGGSFALVTPQSWWFLKSYQDERAWLLRDVRLRVLATLGEEAWQSFGDRGPVACLMVADPNTRTAAGTIAALDALPCKTIDEKRQYLRSGPLGQLEQSRQLKNPDQRITIEELGSGTLLEHFADSFQGIKTGDDPRFLREFWEVDLREERWQPIQSTVSSSCLVGGLSSVVDWTGDGSQMARRQGMSAHGRPGVIAAQMRDLPACMYWGTLFDGTVSALVPHDTQDVAAVWAFCTSAEYAPAVRRIDKGLAASNASMAQVPFDRARWTAQAKAQLGDWDHLPSTDDATQWFFHGGVAGLQEAVARVIGFQWPGEIRALSLATGAATKLGEVERLADHVDNDGIVSIQAIRGEAAAADRVQAVLASAFGADWSAARLGQLLIAAGASGSLDEWLRQSFFESHCEAFHQRPFIWQVWDGMKDGFSAFVSYHRLTAPNGEGRRTLEKLTHTYLGNWLDRQRAEQKAGVEGADGRVAAAEHLKRELEKILEGEPPYDIFVRWKPLHQQPLGWEPDINDGVRVNIRPFMIAKPLNARGKNACILRVPPKIKWDKDRGKEPTREKAEFPWFWSWDESTQDFAGGKEFDGNRWNDLHYTRAAKLAARERAKGGRS